jgi:hypothetical protein
MNAEQRAQDECKGTKNWLGQEMQDTDCIKNVFKSEFEKVVEN